MSKFVSLTRFFVSSDFSKIQPHLKDNEACYILYRLDSTNAISYEWVLFSYVPDKAKVRILSFSAVRGHNLTWLCETGS